MQLYRPVRMVQRAMPGLLREAAPSVAYTYGRRMLNAAGGRIRNFRRSLFGRALEGAIVARNLNSNMPPSRSRSRLGTPQSLQTRGRSMTRRTSRTRSASRSSRRMSVSRMRSLSRATSRATSVSTKDGRKSGVIQNIKAKTTGKRGKINKRQNYTGVTKTWEAYGKVTGLNAVYLGHATCAYTRIFEMIFRALTKELALKLGIAVSDFSLPCGFVLTGDTWRVNYRVSTESALLSNFNFISGGPAYSLENVATGLWTNFLVALKDTDPNSQAELISMEYIPSSNIAGAYPYTRIDLKYMKVNMSVVSSLKFQNQTPSGLESDEIERVDQCPLEGKLYIGSGTGTRTVSDIATSGNTLIAQENSAITAAFAPGPGTNQVFLKEPPPAKDFLNVSHCQYVSIDPGQIMKNTLKASHNMYINDFIRHLLTGGSLAPTRVFSKLGKFTLFGMEKAIYNPEEAAGINLVWEINQYYKCNTYYAQQPPTAHVVQADG